MQARCLHSLFIIGIMQKLLLLLTACLLSASLFAQSDSRTELLKKLEASKISLEVKGLMKPVLHNSEEEDCTPPPCSGLVDPWTCECYSDLKDPWGDEKIASRMKAVLRLESAMLKGKGGNLLPNGMAKKALKLYPGRSLKAIHSRAGMYVDALR